MTGGNRTDAGAAGPADRGPIWLPLLRSLGRSVPGWVVLKNVASAFEGRGDIDTMAPPAAWPTIEATFRTWAEESGLSMVGVCRHNWRGPNLLARRPGDHYLFILDVKATRSWRFSRLIKWDQALTFTVLDADGYPRVRTGASGTLKLLLNGTGYGGRCQPDGMIAKHVREELNQDPAGAFAAARLVGAAAPALRRGVRAAMDGGWSRGDMRAVEAWSLVRAAAHPRDLVLQVDQRLTIADKCASLRLSHRAGRRLPDDPSAWLREFADTHPKGPASGVRQEVA